MANSRMTAVVSIMLRVNNYDMFKADVSLSSYDNDAVTGRFLSRVCVCV